MCELESLQLRRNKLCLLFEMHKNTQHRPLFPRTVADHGHQLRHPELYIVNRARQSAIPHMQQLLNSHIL